MLVDALWALVGVGLCLAIGGAIAYDGLRRRRVGSQLRVPPTTTSVTGTEDVVELRGTAEPHPDHVPLDAPFSDGDCLYRQWRVTERRLVYDRSRRTVGKGSECVPFRLADGHGRVDIATETFDTLLIDPNTDPGLASWFGTPKPVREFVTNHVGAEAADAGMFSPRRTFQQTLLKPGDEVYVYGRPKRTDSEFFETYVVTGFDRDSESSAVISDYSDRRLRLQSISGWLRVSYGVAVATTGSLLSLTAAFDHPATTIAVWLFIAVVAVGLLFVLATAVRSSVRQLYYTRIAS